MPALQLFAGLTLMLAMSTASAQRFTQYVSEEDSFRIMTPGEFSIEATEIESEYGIIIPMRTYSHENDDGVFSVTVVDYTDSQRLHDARIEELDGLYVSTYGEVDARASVAWFAKKIRDQAETIEYDAYHYIGKVDGHQLQTTNPDGTRTFAALYLHRSKLYVVEARVNARSPVAAMFQQTLDFMYDGRRIFYDEFREAYKVLPPTGITPPPVTRDD